MRVLSVVVCFAFAACPGPETPGGGVDSGGAVDSGGGNGDSGVSLDVGGGTGTDVPVQPPTDSGPMTLDAGLSIDTGPGGGVMCGEGMQCMMDCANFERACVNECIEQVADDQQGLARAVAACAFRHSCEDAQCMMQNCRNEGNACMQAGGPQIVDGGPGPGPGGDGQDCARGMGCMMECDGMAPDCLRGCVERVREDQRQLASAVAECATRNQCRDVNCMMRNCRTEGDACFEAGGGPGPNMDGGPMPPRGDGGAPQGGGCIGGMECFFACRAGDQQCVSRCIDGVEPQHRAVTRRSVTCAQRNNCQTPDCFMGRCQAEARACGEAGGGGGQPPGPGAGDGGPPMPGPGDGGQGGPPQPGGGNDTCADFIGCLDACPERDNECPNTCMARVRQASAQVTNALVGCMMNSQCMDMDCARTRCANEMRRCMADRN